MCVFATITQAEALVRCAMQDGLVQTARRRFVPLDAIMARAKYQAVATVIRDGQASCATLVWQDGARL